MKLYDYIYTLYTVHICTDITHLNLYRLYHINMCTYISYIYIYVQCIYIYTYISCYLHNLHDTMLLTCYRCPIFWSHFLSQLAPDLHQVITPGLATCSEGSPRLRPHLVQALGGGMATGLEHGFIFPYLGNKHPN